MIDRGIVIGHERGIITSASLMVNERSAAAATVAVGGLPRLVGLHLDLGEWEFVEDGWRSAYAVTPSLNSRPSRGSGTHRSRGFQALRGLGDIQVGGRWLDGRAREFRRFANMPPWTSEDFVIALAIDPGDDPDRAMLERNRWSLVDATRVTGGPTAFRDYVQGSWAEFSVSQDAYVWTSCGWFADRGVRYLAAGLPVVVQDTGFGSTLPTGDGIVSFRSIDDAVRAANSVRRRYALHAEAARQISADFFEARRVLEPLVSTIAGTQ